MDAVMQVWVFNGERSRFASGVFLERRLAEDWIRKHGASGILTAYPVNSGVYDWALSQRYFHPKKPEHESPQFVQSFTSAYQEHLHYENGECVAGVPKTEGTEPSASPA